MATKTTLNARNLEMLGAARLAVLLIEISTGSAVAKRRLRLELAGAHSPQEAAREVSKRLASIARSRSTVTWSTRKALTSDLESQLRAITEQIAPADPAEALALTWRFLQVATPLMARCDDGTGAVMDVFHVACAALGAVALAAQPQPDVLARAAFDALHDNAHGQYDGLIAILYPALGAEGLAQLKRLIETMAATAVPVPPRNEWQIAGYGLAGKVYAHQIQERTRQTFVRSALREIADVGGDVDGYIAQFDPDSRKTPRIAAEIAARLVAAGRADEALAILDRTEFRDRGSAPEAWQNVRLDALEALGRIDEAQAARLDYFRQGLSAVHLRAHLKRLPDFDDVEAEDAALTHVAAHPAASVALQFLIQWPALDRAAQLIQQRLRDLDGDQYGILTPAAEALSQRYPLAATLTLRAMIDLTLNAAKSSRYQHAARHLATCATLAPLIADYGPFEPHGSYIARLKRLHARKAAFWNHVE
ncbi:MAG: hypothetical protein H7245_13330 [Candidatus Saccharibacteria bacterium]|nr:hypothetical protein [Pseudorhodobacter sp.]